MPPRTAGFTLPRRSETRAASPLVVSPSPGTKRPTAPFLGNGSSRWTWITATRAALALPASTRKRTTAMKARRIPRFWPTRPAAALRWPRARQAEPSANPRLRPAQVPDHRAGTARPALRRHRRDRDASGTPDSTRGRRDCARRARGPADRGRDSLPRGRAHVRGAGAGGRGVSAGRPPGRPRRARDSVLPLLDVRLPRALVA